jgi:O-antigen ligase
MNSVLSKIFPWGLLSLGIVMIVKDQFIVPFILLALISSFPLWRKPVLSRKLLPMYLLISLYFSYIVWLLFSTNMDYGRRDIETKLSFIIFPLVFIFSSGNWTAMLTRKVKDGIIIGACLSMAISFGRALTCKWSGGEICFRNDQFGFNMHATYLSLIYLFALLLFLERKITFRYEILLKLAFSLLTILAIYYLRSLSTLLATGVLIFAWVIWWIVSSRKWLFLCGFPIIFIFGWLALKKLPFITSDFSKTFDTVKAYYSDPDEFLKTHTEWNESNTVRIIVWRFSIELIAREPLGVGTGDVKDELFNVYRSHGYDLFAEKQLNTHNQFLQSGVALGFIGMLLLLGIFVTSIKKIRCKEDLILNAFLLLSFITCLFESYLERQVGVMFFSFLLCCLLTDWKLRSEIR